MPGISAVESRDCIRIRGARAHNLQNLNLDIPRNRLVVMTGPSGSGKSTLALDTLFAEGQRQYIETLSIYSRQFFHQRERPDLDSIDGLQPTICLDQHLGAANPRSTVATLTEIYDYLRLLMARLGHVICHGCGETIRQQTVEQIRDRLLELPEGTKLMLLAPMVRGRRGQHQEVFAQIRKARFVRTRIDGTVFDIDDLPELSPRRVHDVEAVVDRIKINDASRARLTESIQVAVQYGDGLVLACFQDPELRHDTPGGWRDELFSTLYACPGCGISVAEIEPRTFSFNSPYGACPQCAGLGHRLQFDPARIIVDPAVSMAAGAVLPWKNLAAGAIKNIELQLGPFLQKAGSGWRRPLSELPPAQREMLLDGDGEDFPGILQMLEKEYVTATDRKRREQLELFRGDVCCRVCRGARLRPEALSVSLFDHTIGDITCTPVSDVIGLLEAFPFDASQQPIARPILADVLQRLRFLDAVGVGYLTLDRAADTLSGGELQRVRLATSIGAGLVGVCYVLDEPSIGLHPRDNQRLIDSLRNLQRGGNTVLVVEHDEAIMRQADRLIDMGPGAGVEGGRIVAAGTPEEVENDPQSLTGCYLSGRRQIPVPRRRRRVAKSRSLQIDGVTTNNLREVSVQFPLESLVCITGVSGSGKSSLVNETLAPAVNWRLGNAGVKVGSYTNLRGLSQIDKLVTIDQSPIGRNPRSSAATYTGVFDEIRKVFAATRDAKQRGFRASRFSFNGKTGRCEACQGYGLQKIEMNVLPDVWLTCEKCRGSRFNRHTLEVRYRDKSIAQVLDLSVSEARGFFENFAVITRSLTSLEQVGLGYLPLGQAATSLSGGEAQRVKLASQLARVDTGKTLYILDEPTSGLHFADIQRLLGVLNALVDRGNSVLVIEHHLDVIKCADWVIDLGPEGGRAGGHILATGTPEQIAALPENQTGQFLGPLLAGD
ncbi:MAG: ABC-ATPase UvrA [Planctomycetaceae bacterium]|nr:ABC-ATPase UvrA [Planctomycetaceae bacterium]